MATEDWDNKAPLQLRTRLALRILLFMLKIISPYRFAHEFSKDLEAIEKLIKEAE